jgi:L-asparaginase II
MTDILSSQPIFAFIRQGIPEVVVSGVTAFKLDRQPLTGPAADVTIVTRSLLKPWQMAASGHFRKEPHWILGLASHSGQPIHMEALLKLRDELHASENSLICPRSFPMDSNVTQAMKANGVQPTRLHHPCSGKHLVMIGAAMAEGHPIDHYWHEDHPLQRRIFSIVGKEANERLRWVVDSCGLPAAAMTIRAITHMWAKFAEDTSESPTAIKTLWTQNPRLAGGARRLDSDIMEAMNGRVLAKEGADGLFLLQTLPNGLDPTATCFIKVASGYSSAHLALSLWALLNKDITLTKTLADLKEYLRSRLEEWVPRDQEFKIF